ncbi:membrane protein insertion efficiency factor YidD [Gordonia sp. CPCC 206044]|uniref:membrane protein insertion efficiency factor YidD n=1 Tax=Gordonia sp. CPCC 206044 TaxID=3140793 RepID=UPI003AF3F2C1
MRDPDPAPSRAGALDWLHLLPRRILIFLIELYRTWISPMRLPTCRFEPTCSGYAVEALERHGFFYGGWLSIVRLLKCGPWHKPGYDPVPERSLGEILTRTRSVAHESAHPVDAQAEDTCTDTSRVVTPTEVKG